MIYYLFLAFVDIFIFLKDHWKELTFTAAASGIGVILGKRIGVKFAVNYIAKYMGLQQQTQIELQVAWLIKQEEARGNPWHTQLNGQRTTRILLYKRFFSLLQAITKPKRRVFTVSKWTSRKFLMAILAAILPIINEQFNMGLDTNVIIAAIGGIVAFILGESHIDAKKIQSTTNYSKIDDSSV